MAVSAIFWTTEATLRSARLSLRETEHVQVFIRRLSLGPNQGNQSELRSSHPKSPSLQGFRADNKGPLLFPSE
jgi:hypothetical protein